MYTYKTYIFFFLFRQPAIKIQVLLRFPHLLEQIFQKIDDESLVECREVARSWQNIIDERKYLWLRLVDIPAILERGNTYLHLAAQTGQIEAFEMALNEEEDKNVENDLGETFFHLACRNGHLNILELLLKITNFYLEVNAISKDGCGAFYLACTMGHSDVVKHLIENASVLGIDINVQNFTLSLVMACQRARLFERGHADVVKILKENADTFSFDPQCTVVLGDLKIPFDFIVSKYSLHHINHK